MTQAANDKEQLTPMVARVQALPEGLNAPDRLLADNGYFSENNVIACQDAQIEPLIAMKREDPHPHWQERFTEPAPLATGASPVETLAHALKTLRGKAHYALRKQTVEPVFGIIDVYQRQPTGSPCPAAPCRPRRKSSPALEPGRTSA